MSYFIKPVFSSLILLLITTTSYSQTNLLLNGGFEDINTCTEYKAECGVEGWFYLQDVKAQMLLNETHTSLVGANSFAIYYNWLGYTAFTPIIGTLLPCGLRKGSLYVFRGLLTAKLNPKLLLNPGICLADKFFVPRRPFSKQMKPDSIVSIKKIQNTPFFEFEYRFIANGDERYLTFGCFVKEDTTGAKKKLIGTQTVSLVLDNFSLSPEDPDETLCQAFLYNKESIYEYNSRHKEMDYSLFGKGELAIELMEDPKINLTRIEKKLPPVKTDTLKLGDLLFDFNKANLKPAAIKMLSDFFVPANSSSIDSIYIEGHTDSIGSDSRNIELSLQRSESLKQWLLTKNILNPGKIQLHPFGRSRPVATNKTAAGRALNRRVEMVIFRKREVN